MRPLRHLMNIAAATSAALCIALPASAQQAPLRLLVGYPAGGSADAAARALSDQLGSALQRPVIIDNRAGAGGMIAAQALKLSAPDGNTVLLVNDHMVAMIPWTMKNPGYDPVKDFESLGQVAKFNLALGASSASKLQSVADTWTARKSTQSLMNYAVPAPASTMQFAGYVLASLLRSILCRCPTRDGAARLGPPWRPSPGGDLHCDRLGRPSHRAGKLESWP